MKNRLFICCLLSLILSIGAMASAASLDIGSASALPGDTVAVPVSISDAAGCAGINLRLEYDPTLLSQPDVIVGPIVGDQHTLDWNAPEPGKLNICIAPSQVPGAFINASGIVAYLVFSVDADAGEMATISTQPALAGPPVILPSGLSDAAGNSLAHSFSDGQVLVTDDTGSLRVELLPQQAADEGAGWRRIGAVDWNASGDTLTPVPIGSCTVEFKDIPGWVTPDAIVVPIEKDALAERQATYQPRPYTLQYAAGTNGTLSGLTSQTVFHGENGSPVEAIGDSGYHFVEWSDGCLDNPRTDLNVSADIDVTALFALHEYLEAYRIVYSNRFSDVQPVYNQNGIYLPAFEGMGVLKIVKLRGKASYPEIPGIYVDGSLAMLYTQSTVGEVYVSGDLRNTQAINAHIRRVYAHNMGTVRMMDSAKSASSDEAEESSTTLKSGDTVNILLDGDGVPYGEVMPVGATGSLDPALYRGNVVLVGVSLCEYTAPNQAATISVGPRKFRWVGDDGVYLDLSLGRIPDLGDNTIEAGYLMRLMARGGTLGSETSAIDAALIQSHAQDLGPRSATRIISRNFRSALLEPATGRYIAEYGATCSPQGILLGTENLIIQVVNGDLKTKRIEANGKITLLRAVRGSVMPGTVKSGCNPLANPMIVNIFGDKGVDGCFQAGVNGEGLPDNRGIISVLRVNPRVDPAARIQGEVWVVPGHTVRLIGDTLAFDEERLKYMP